MTTYNPLDYQIQREVKTSIQIDGKTALYVEKRYVDSTSRGDKWTRQQLQAANENYLKNRFHGEHDKISGSTYEMETCVKETCKKKCQECKQMCQLCGFVPGFSVDSCAHRCSLAYAGNRGFRAKKIDPKLIEMQKYLCEKFNRRIGTHALEHEDAISNAINVGFKINHRLYTGVWLDWPNIPINN